MHRFLLSFSLLLSGLLISQDQTADDILFLKIQELEEEIAFLRSELESQAYLLEKLQNEDLDNTCLLYTSPSPRDLAVSRMPSSA